MCWKKLFCRDNLNNPQIHFLLCEIAQKLFEFFFIQKSFILACILKISIKKFKKISSRLQYVSRMLACKFSVCECVYEEKAYPASTFMCAHEKIYGLPENNGLVELVQERNCLLILVIFIIIHFLFSIAGWNWTNNLPSNAGQQSVVVVKKSTYSGEKLIYGKLYVC